MVWYRAMTDLFIVNCKTLQGGEIQALYPVISLYMSFFEKDFFIISIPESEKVVSSWQKTSVLYSSEINDSAFQVKRPAKHHSYSSQKILFTVQNKSWTLLLLQCYTYILLLKTYHNTFKGTVIRKKYKLIVSYI